MKINVEGEEGEEIRIIIIIVYADHYSTSSSNKIIETGMLTEYRHVTRKLHVYLFTLFATVDSASQSLGPFQLTHGIISIILSDCME